MRLPATVWELGVATLAIALPASACLGQQPSPGFADALLGRWDLSIEEGGGSYPSWFEIQLRTETEIMGRFVGRFGSVRQIADLAYESGQVEFAVPVQYEPQQDDLRFIGVLNGDRIEGSTFDANGRSLRWYATRAPSLQRDGAPVWGVPTVLFNHRDLSGWTGRDGAAIDCWRVDAGALSVTPPCVDLITEQEFEDFRLQADFLYPPGSNSGIYLRGRYEVQIQDDAGKALDPLRMGGVYGFLRPKSDAARTSDEWQSFDITLIGRRVTIRLNDVVIIDNEEIPGITGGALDSHEALAGPIMLQGDHGPIRFRNIVLTPSRPSR